MSEKAKKTKEYPFWRQFIIWAVIGFFVISVMLIFSFLLDLFGSDVELCTDGNWQEIKPPDDHFGMYKCYEWSTCAKQSIGVQCFAEGGN